MDEIIETYQLDIQHKTKIANSYRASRPRKFMTPFDYVTGKEKRQYKKAGRVTRWNMNELLNYEDFKALDDESQATALKAYREKFKNGDIQKFWGINHDQYYKIIHRLGLKTREPKTASKPSKPKVTKTKQNDFIAVTAEAVAMPTAPPTAQQYINLIAEPTECLILDFEVTGQGESLRGKIERLLGVLEGEEAKFKISLKVEELR